MIMIESEGITEDVATWRTDVAARFARELGLDNIMFEAADPAVFAFYVKSYGPEVNLFVDHSQVGRCGAAVVTVVLWFVCLLLKIMGVCGTMVCLY